MSVVQWSQTKSNSARYSPAQIAMARGMVEKLQRGEDQRAHRIAQVRAALASGRMERPLRLDITVDRLLDDLAA